MLRLWSKDERRSQSYSSPEGGHNIVRDLHRRTVSNYGVHTIEHFEPVIEGATTLSCGEVCGSRDDGARVQDPVCKRASCSTSIAILWHICLDINKVTAVLLRAKKMPATMHFKFRNVNVIHKAVLIRSKEVWICPIVLTVDKVGKRGRLAQVGEEVLGIGYPLLGIIANDISSNLDIREDTTTIDSSRSASMTLGIWENRIRD